MYIVQVFAHVKPEFVNDFRKACLENAINSLNEPGIARFDVLQQEDDPSRFILFEIYRTAGDPARHRETNHYRVWKDSVEKWMAEPRTKTIYVNCFPDDKGWG